MAHWIRRTTYAFLEGLNSVFSAVKRKTCGLRSTENLIAMLYFAAARLDIPATYRTQRGTTNPTSTRPYPRLSTLIKNASNWRRDWPDLGK